MAVIVLLVFVHSINIRILRLSSWMNIYFYIVIPVASYFNHYYFFYPLAREPWSPSCPIISKFFVLEELSRPRSTKTALLLLEPNSTCYVWSATSLVFILHQVSINSSLWFSQSTEEIYTSSIHYSRLFMIYASPVSIIGIDTFYSLVVFFHHFKRLNSPSTWLQRLRNSNYINIPIYNNYSLHLKMSYTS